MMKILLPLFLIMVFTNSVKTSVFLLSCLWCVSSFLLDLKNLPSLTSFSLLDSLSFSLSMLTLYIVICLLFASMSNSLLMKSQVLFNPLVISLLLTLLLAFSMNSFLTFYIFFEASIIPTFILILGWGYQPERKQASMYLLMYTLFSSLPLLISLLILYKQFSSSSFFLPHTYFKLSLLTQMWAFFLFFAFLVKLPLYFTHMWLPKAHVEAPVSGSMILAAILLKLGGYGIFRMATFLFSLIPFMNSFFMTWACLGGVLASVSCVFQTDVKMLIALSSVAHMSLVSLGVFSLSGWGLMGAQSIMVGHGFCSSGLFCIANMSYERTLSRNVFMFKNSFLLPSFILWWFLLCIGNMANPPSLNLLGELYTISAVTASFFSFLPFMMILVFMAAVYSLYLFSSTQHNKSTFFFLSPSSLTLREHLLMLLHWLPLNTLFLIPTSFLLTFY